LSSVLLDHGTTILGIVTLNNHAGNSLGDMHRKPLSCRLWIQLTLPQNPKCDNASLVLSFSASVMPGSELRVHARKPTMIMEAVQIALLDDRLTIEPN
jgi:hypothetical protein